MKKLFSKYDFLPFTFLAAVLVFFRLGFHSFELDEAFSLYISKDLGQMFKILWNNESNMGLYYFLLYFWQFLGTSEFAVRSLSAICAILSVPLVYKIASLMFDRSTARISSLLLAINIYFIYVGQLARGYSLLLLLSLVSTYSYLHLKKYSKARYVYVVSLIASVFTHYYAILLFISHALDAFTRKFAGSFIKIVWPVLIVLPVIFIAPSFSSGQIDWIAAPTVKNLIGTIFVLAGDFPPLFIVYGLIFAMSLPFLVSRIRNEKMQFTLIWLTGPVVFAFIFSIFVKPIFQSVYFIVCLPPFLILSAHLIDQIKVKKIKETMLAAIIILSIARLYLWYSGNAQHQWILSNTSEDWRALAHYVDLQEETGDSKIFFGYYNRLPYGLYAKDNAKFVEISSGLYSLGGGSSLPYANLNLIASFNHSRVWVIKRKADLGNFNDREILDQIHVTLIPNYNLEEETKFPEVSVELWSKI